MNWSSEPPKVPGWYWFRQWLDADSYWNVDGVGKWETPRIAQVEQPWVGIGFPANVIIRPGAKTEWSGPIEPPKE